MKTLMPVACLALICVATPLAAQSKDQKPNIVVILADDMGYSDIGCFGGEVKTPNIDKLAAGGLRFTNFFNTARCCPTRAALMTGLYSHQAGVGHMTENKKLPGYQGELHRNCVTIPEVLRRAGYGCYMVGKWHLSSRVNMKAPNDSWPLGRGFERFYGTLTGAGSFYKPVTLTRDNTPIEAPDKDYYYTDAIGSHAVDFLAEHRRKKKDAPFFLYCAFTSPHWPMHALQEDVQRYDNVYAKGWDLLRQERHERMKSLGIVDPKWATSVRDKDIPAWNSLTADKKKEMARKMAIYAAMIDRMDQNVGRVVADLKKNGELDNTLIFFLSDNGGCAEGGLFGFERQEGGVVGEHSSFASYGECWAWLSNAIFRLYKHWVHAGGVSTPLIVHWPRRIEHRGVLRRQPGHLIDIMATCVDVAGVEYPTEHQGNTIASLEGRSLVPAFADGKIERTAIYWEHEGNKAVLDTQGMWKLVSKHPGGWELYDLKADRAEMNDLAKEHPDRVRELEALWDRWAARANVRPWEEVQKAKGSPKE